jgi:hypothetical protein
MGVKWRDAREVEWRGVYAGSQLYNRGSIDLDNGENPDVSGS